MNAMQIPETYQFKNLNTAALKKSIYPGISKVTKIKIEGKRFE
jgi:hypothetical protein